jgi:hypothetical protein
MCWRVPEGTVPGGEDRRDHCRAPSCSTAITQSSAPRRRWVGDRQTRRRRTLAPGRLLSVRGCSGEAPTRMRSECGRRPGPAVGAADRARRRRSTAVDLETGSSVSVMADFGYPPCLLGAAGATGLPGFGRRLRGAIGRHRPIGERREQQHQGDEEMPERPPLPVHDRQWPAPRELEPRLESRECPPPGGTSCQAENRERR